MNRERVGELFVLGFRGLEIPAWLREFEREMGLGGVILFDYNCQTRAYENNIQLPSRCAQALRGNLGDGVSAADHSGPGRRQGEAPQGEARIRSVLPSAQAFNLLAATEKESIAERSFREMRSLGFHMDLTPVIDLNLNPANPDIGAVERSFSANPAEVRANVEILNRVARRTPPGTVP